MRKRRSLILAIAILLVVSFSVGYAYLNTTLKINGNVKISKNDWKVKFTKVENELYTRLGRTLENQNKYIKTPATITSSSQEEDLSDIINFSVNLDKPGDVYTFKAYRANQGTIDAILTSYQVTGLDGTEKYLTLNINDPNADDDYTGDPSGYGNLLSKPELNVGEENYITVTLTFETDIEEEDLLDEDLDLNVSIQLNYEQNLN